MLRLHEYKHRAGHAKQTFSMTVFLATWTVSVIIPLPRPSQSSTPAPVHRLKKLILQGLQEAVSPKMRKAANVLAPRYIENGREVLRCVH